VFIVYPFVSCTISPFNPILSIPTSFATQISQHPLIYPYPILFPPLLPSFSIPFCRAKKTLQGSKHLFILAFYFPPFLSIPLLCFWRKKMDVGFGLNSPLY
jgi:hypothetical protein